jgi:hypothetical protein
VPHLSAAIVGDIAYNDVHIPLFELDPDTRKDWVDAVEEIQGRNPRLVIASHRKTDAIDDALALSRTVEYLQLGDALLSADPRPNLADFVAQMIAAHPTRANQTTLIYSGVMQGLK